MALNDLEKLSKTNNYEVRCGYDVLDSGSYILNMLMGGGLPLGKFIQIYSESGYGKTTITLSVVKYLCLQGHKVIYIDAEGASKQLLMSMGFWGRLSPESTNDNPKFIVDGAHPNLVHSKDNPEGPFWYFEGVSKMSNVEEIIEQGVPKFDDKGNPTQSDFKLVVIDSVPFVVPDGYDPSLADKERTSIGSRQPGQSAAMWTKFVEKFTYYKTAFNMTFWFINQLREDLSMNTFKHEEKMTGGKAFFYSLDLSIKILAGKNSETFNIDTNVGGTQNVTIYKEVTVVAKKNKLCIGNVSFPLGVFFGYGISNLAVLPYILPNKMIVTDKGESKPMIEGNNAWKILRVNVPKDDKFETLEIKCNGSQQLKQELRKYYSVIASQITGADFDVLKNGIEGVWALADDGYTRTVI